MTGLWAPGERSVAAGGVLSRTTLALGGSPNMRDMDTLTAPAPQRWAAALWAGAHASWLTILLIVAINAGFAGLMSIEDERPLWHPLVSTQCFGLCIAYAVNVASPWERTRPILRLCIAVAIGTIAGYGLVFLIKGIIMSLPGYTLGELVRDRAKFQGTLVSAFALGLFVSLFFLLKFRETRAESALHRAEAERHQLSKLALESELKLMQAQVEPHFLFNTLASVQYLTETDPPQASRLLGHLLAYLRAALPQLRSASATLGQEIALAEAYLNILQMRMGKRLAFEVDAATDLRAQPFPPGLLISVVENAITHGIEPQAEGGTVRIEARRHDDRLVVTVSDTGAGLSAVSRPGQGVGLANVRERVAALYGAKARFSLVEGAPRGTRASIEIPIAPGDT
jgi:sensor histidine kinase YesM